MSVQAGKMVTAKEFIKKALCLVHSKITKRNGGRKRMGIPVRFRLLFYFIITPLYVTEGGLFFKNCKLLI